VQKTKFIPTPFNAMTLDLSGPAGRLEGLLDEPPGTARALAVLAHPHPRDGGSMRSRVVYEAARGFVRAGAATLRFNFRGVGRSEGTFTDGRGEALDFRAAVDGMAARHPGLPVWAAGYAFGAGIAASAAADDERITAIIAIAPLVDRDEVRAALSGAKPTFLIHGDRDEVCSLREMHRFYAQLPEPRELIVIDAADHAFDGRASEVGDAITDLLADFDGSTVGSG
jgi:alpha/beta superfamily hydrolase